MIRSETLRQIIGNAVLLAVALALSILMRRVSQGGVVVWLTNGVVLAAYLRTPVVAWPAQTLALCIAILVPWATLNGRPEVLATFVVHVLIMMGPAYLLQRDRDWVEGRSDTMRAWMRFGLLAVLLVPTADSIVAILLTRTFTMSFAVPYLLADALGIALVTPTLLRVTPDYFRALAGSRNITEALLLLVAQIILTGTAVTFGKTPIWLLLAVPLPILLLFRFGFAAAWLGTVLFTVVLFGATIYGTGPLFLLGLRSVKDALVIAQLYSLYVAAILVIIAALLNERDALTATADLNREIYEIIAMHSGDMLFVCDLEGNTLFVSPSMGEHFGRPTSEFMGRTEKRKLLHPDDFPVMEAMVAAVAAGKRPASVVLRFAHRDGTYRSMEVIVRPGPIRKQGAPPLLIGSMRDITDRLDEERALRARGAELETLAATDSLTGLPNRRRYDEMLATEWARAAREGAPLSLLVIDADRFKLVNDNFGHETGDSYLRQIAQAISSEIRRPGDLAARVGGEEFAVLLPGTGPTGARILAERIRERMEEACLPLTPKSPTVLTLSIGVATARPRPGVTNHLFADADAALYAAKSSGRNRVVQAPEHPDRDGGTFDGPGWIDSGSSGRPLVS